LNVTVNDDINETVTTLRFADPPDPSREIR